MKKFIYFLIIAAVGLIVYNISFLDTNNLLDGESLVALIGIFASACAIVLLLILKTVKTIEKKAKS
ncbi:MAG: hypothetical protein ACI9SJ_000747 [Flavobacteriaceae bacterium]|jgi:hypothetical protein|uniref:hypothetical protein n=1 Tax=Candidatus Marifrigoribacter sp. Uisw_064 TaxID=3230970 RepID=UPI003ADF00FE